jgi:hypothetical protein
MLRQGYMLEKGEGRRRAGFQTTEIAVCFCGRLFAITLTACSTFRHYCSTLRAHHRTSTTDVPHPLCLY